MSKRPELWRLTQGGQQSVAFAQGKEMNIQSQETGSTARMENNVKETLQLEACLYYVLLLCCLVVCHPENLRGVDTRPRRQLRES